MNVVGSLAFVSSGSQIIKFIGIAIGVLGSMILFGAINDAIKRYCPITVTDDEVIIKKVKFPFSHSERRLIYPQIKSFSIKQTIRQTVKAHYPDNLVANPEFFEIELYNYNEIIILSVGPQHKGSRKEIVQFVNERI